MAETMLTCAVQLQALSEGEIGLAFELRNPGRQSVQLSYFQPFADFDLVAEAADGPVTVVQPAYDTGVSPVDVAVASGQSVRIATPIRLRFDSQVSPAGGDVPTRWSLQHAPAPLTLRFTLHLQGAEVAPCETRLDPKRLK